MRPPVLKILESLEYPGVRLVSPGKKGVTGFLDNEICGYTKDICSASSGHSALKILSDMKILCARGEGGLELRL